MRKVKFRRWIPRIDEKTDFGTKAKVGTNCWEDGFPNEGFFHEWASDYEESSEGFGNFTVAIIELDNGMIEKVLPTNIQFID